MQKVIGDIIANYEIVGENNKNTILILHGWGRNLNDWMTVAKALSSKYRIILINLPGHGASSLPTKAFDTFDYADFVDSLLGKLGVSNFILIGHSFGGKVAAALASKSKKIDMLTLVAASGVEDRSFASEIKVMLAKLLRKSRVPRTILNFLIWKLASGDYKNAGALLPTFKKIVTQKIDNDIKQINIPTIIVWGENDKEVPISSAKKLRELIKNSHLRVVWGAGHHPHLEKPDKFIVLLNEYI